MEVSPDQATQIANMYELLQSAQIQYVFPLIFTHSLAVVVTLGSAVLLIKTAVGTRKSRFLKYLAVSVFSNVAFRLGSIIYLLLKAALASLVLDGVKPQGTAALAYVSSLNALESTWHSIDISMSLLSSVFLFAAWDLIRHYPHRTGVSRSFFGVLTALFGSGSILTIAISGLDVAERIHKHLWGILDVIDVSAATLGLVLVGWQLHKTLGPLVKTPNRVLRATLSWTTAFLYIIWGVVQPLYLLLSPTPWYSVTLLMLGFGSTILTIILCSQALEERPESNSSLPK